MITAPSVHVAIIGAGVTGLTAAAQLADRGLSVALFEKSPFPGGHAISLACKATDACVKCGACLAEEALARVRDHGQIAIHAGTRIESIAAGSPHRIAYRFHTPLVAARRCDGCGLCITRCPVPGAIVQGSSAREGAFVAIRPELCRHFEESGCSLCRDCCPRAAIQLAHGEQAGRMTAEAILVASGFTPFDPRKKPYGYGRFADVITSWEAERRLRASMQLVRPSDGEPVRRLAFIQCVGSRDACLGHNWCSTICCGSALRMARLIRHRQPEVQVSFFYIDLQTFGRDFSTVAEACRQEMALIRAIPGEIVQSVAKDLEISYFDPQTRKNSQVRFDLAVLSVGLMPGDDNRRLAQMLGATLTDDGFWPSAGDGDGLMPPGVFSAGTATAPMGIAASMASARQAAHALARYLENGGKQP